MTKAQKELNRRRIARIYGQRCSGIRVPIHELPKIYKIAEACIAFGLDDSALGDAIKAAADAVARN